MTKNKIKCIIIILINVGTVNAGENTALSFQFGNYGFGSNFGPDKNNIELSLGLVNIFWDNLRTNTGLKLSPFNLYTNIEATEGPETKSIAYLNFLNMNLYWNCLNGTEAIVGPFLSVEYLILRDWENINFDDITINSGIKFMHKNNGAYFSMINYHRQSASYAVEMEIGYRYNNYDGHKFFFSVKTDLIDTLLFIANIGAFLGN